MHYVICYDLENDQLRDRVAKLLQRRGCSRIQRSVFVAPHYDRRDLGTLKTALRALRSRYAHGPTDSILFVPLRDGDEAAIFVLGDNNVHTELAPPPLKIIL